MSRRLKVRYYYATMLPGKLLAVACNICCKRENFSYIRMSWAFVESYYSNGFLMRSYVQVPLWRPRTKECCLLLPPLKVTTYTPVALPLYVRFFVALPQNKEYSACKNDFIPYFEAQSVRIEVFTRLILNLK